MKSASGGFMRHGKFIPVDESGGRGINSVRGANGTIASGPMPGTPARSSTLVPRSSVKPDSPISRSAPTIRPGGAPKVSRDAPTVRPAGAGPRPAPKTQVSPQPFAKTQVTPGVKPPPKAPKVKPDKPVKEPKEKRTPLSTGPKVKPGKDPGLAFVGKTPRAIKNLTKPAGQKGNHGSSAKLGKSPRAGHPDHPKDEHVSGKVAAALGRAPSGVGLIGATVKAVQGSLKGEEPKSSGGGGHHGG